MSRSLTDSPGRQGAAPARELRADAERNRRLIVEAARAVFAEQGVAAPLEQIAARAGVGIATLYRRFPNREDLVAASFEAAIAEYAQSMEESLHNPDPWDGFVCAVTRVCAMQAADRGLRDVLTMTFPSATKLERDRAKALAGFLELVQRAQSAGALREDFVFEDLVLILVANAGVVRATADHAPDAWKRFVALMLESCRAHRSAPLPAPPEPLEMRQAMSGLSDRARPAPRHRPPVGVPLVGDRPGPRATPREREQMETVLSMALRCGDLINPG